MTLARSWTCSDSRCASGALPWVQRETRAADESVLSAVVQAIREHESGEKSVAVSRGE